MGRKGDIGTHNKSEVFSSGSLTGVGRMDGLLSMSPFLTDISSSSSSGTRGADVQAFKPNTVLALLHPAPILPSFAPPISTSLSSASASVSCGQSPNLPRNIGP